MTTTIKNIIIDETGYARVSVVEDGRPRTAIVDLRGTELDALRAVAAAKVPAADNVKAHADARAARRGLRVQERAKIVEARTAAREKARADARAAAGRDR